MPKFPSFLNSVFCIFLQSKHCLVPRRLFTFLNTNKRVAHRKTLHEVLRRQAMPEGIVGRARLRTRPIIPCARHPDFAIAQLRLGTRQGSACLSAPSVATR